MNKKKIYQRSVWLGLALLLLLSSVPASASFSLRVVVDNTRIWFPDAEPYVDKNQRAMVPVRFVSEKLGAKVNWDAANNKVTITEGTKTIVLEINKKEIRIDGKTEKMDTAAVLKDNRTFVPIRFVSQALGATIKWDQAVSTVYITTGKPAVETNGETKTVGEFTVPKKFVAHEDEYAGQEAVFFTLSYFYRNYEAQVMDLADTLSQKFSDEIVQEVVEHLMKKTGEGVYLEYKAIELDISKHEYIIINESRADSVEIYYLLPKK